MVSEFDDELIVPDGSLGIGDGAIEPWRKNGKRMNMYYGRLMRRFCDRAEITRTMPYDKLTTSMRRILMHGTTESNESSRTSYSPTPGTISGPATSGSLATT